jgi:hypothetical protein
MQTDQNKRIKAHTRQKTHTHKSKQKNKGHVFIVLYVPLFLCFDLCVYVYDLVCAFILLF